MIGGIAASATNSTITNCFVTGDIISRIFQLVVELLENL